MCTEGTNNKCLYKARMINECDFQRHKFWKAKRETKSFYNHQNEMVILMRLKLKKFELTASVLLVGL
jgi:hypothetical protein